MAANVVLPNATTTCLTYDNLPICNVVEQLSGVDHFNGYGCVRRYDAGCATCRPRNARHYASPSMLRAMLPVTRLIGTWSLSSYAFIPQLTLAFDCD